MLRLLKLNTKVRKRILALGDPLDSPIVTERGLRNIVSLKPEEQMRGIEEILVSLRSN